LFDERHALHGLAGVELDGAQVDIRAKPLRRSGCADLEGALEIGNPFGLADLHPGSPERVERTYADVVQSEILRHL
jgi:hypothetical protein